MTAREADRISRLIAVCESCGPYCLIGGLAVNCYVEPVYTLDANIVLIGSPLRECSARALALGGRLHIEFPDDQRYQSFVTRAVEAEVLGIQVKVAALQDVVRGKLWAYQDPQRRLSKRKKDELDLIRLAEAYPELIALYPNELREILEH